MKINYREMENTIIKQITEEIMNIKLKTINPDKDDIVIIQFPLNLPFDVCESVYSYVQHCFPTRRVLALKDDNIDIKTIKQK